MMHGTTNIKSRRAVLIYFAAEAGSHAWHDDDQDLSSHDPMQRHLLIIRVVKFVLTVLISLYAYAI